MDRDFARIGVNMRHKNLTTIRQRPGKDFSPTRLPNLDRAKLALPPDLPNKSPNDVSGLKQYLNQNTASR